MNINHLKDRFSIFLQQQPTDVIWKDPVWQLAAGLAIIFHVILLTISFVAPSADHAAMQDVTVAVHLSPQQKVENADYIAQADQQGAGSLRSSHRLTSPDQQQALRDQQEIAENIRTNSEKKQQVSEQAEQVLVTTLSWQERARNKERKAQAKKQASSSPDLAQAAMIATLEAQYAKRKQEYTKKTSIRTVDSVSTKSADEAAYLDKFRMKVERLGNKHYPNEARAKDMHGDVRLMVILTPDGKIRAIRLLQTSGYGVLDEAAKDSVRQAAPFGKFDKKMRKFSELRVIRTWRFSSKQDDVEVGS